MTINVWLNESCKPLSEVATKSDLQQLKEEIMSAISEFAERQTALLDGIDTAVDGIVTTVGAIATSVNGITTDVSYLKDVITQLQNSPGGVTPQDQTLLDNLEGRINTLKTKVDTANASVAAAQAAAQALDDATVPPVSEPPPEGGTV